MAGQRRASGQPMQRQQKYERRRDTLNRRLADAATGQDRVAAASDFLRGAIAACNPPAPLVEESVRQMVRAAEVIYRQAGVIR